MLNPFHAEQVEYPQHGSRYRPVFVEPKRSPQAPPHQPRHHGAEGDEPRTSTQGRSEPLVDAWTGGRARLGKRYDMCLGEIAGDRFGFGRRDPIWGFLGHPSCGRAPLLRRLASGKGPFEPVANAALLLEQSLGLSWESRSLGGFVSPVGHCCNSEKKYAASMGQNVFQRKLSYTSSDY